MANSTEQPPLERTSAYLIWEDADHDTWWLARCQNEEAVYIIAKDSITPHVLILRQVGGSGPYKVIGAISVSMTTELSGVVAEAKRLGVKWISNPRTASLKSSVRRWRLMRWGKIGVREVPLALASLFMGILLAFFVSAFFIMTDLTGWSMVVIGTVFGALFGWVLKWVADRKLASLTGAIGRFFTVTCSVITGAFVTVMLFLFLFGT